MSFEYLSKTNVGPIYVTAHNGWAGLLVTGEDPYSTGLMITGARFEGYAPLSAPHPHSI
jgi:hypothetical protein